MSQSISPEDTSKSRGGILSRIGQFPFVHKAIAFLQIYRLGNFILSRFPVRHHFAEGDISIRIRSLAGFVLAEEIFQQESYRSALAGVKVETLADLGCNVGWFPCYLAKSSGTRNLRGLLVDGDPAMVEEARWHLRRNNIDGCEPMLGAAGCGADREEVTFYVNPSNTQSSAQAFGADHPYPVKGSVKQVTVPAFVLSREWPKRFGAAQIDLLKIDIEGTELEFLKQEITFIQQRVKRIVCEWHQWHVTFEEIDAFLQSSGFKLVAITEQNAMGGVAVHERV